MGRWPDIVGAEVAQHCAPVTFEAGVLTVRADSTAWATQIRLLASSILGRLEGEVGKSTVTERGSSGRARHHGRGGHDAPRALARATPTADPPNPAASVRSCRAVQVSKRPSRGANAVTASASLLRDLTYSSTHAARSG